MKALKIGGILAVIILAIGLYFKFIVTPSISLDKLTDIKKLNGDMIDMNNYLGKPIVVCFWATWCPPCRKELPGLEQLKNELGDKIEIILLSDESTDHLMKFQNTRNTNVTILQGGERSNYGVYFIPTTYFYNSSGELINKHKDYLDYKSLKELVAEIN